MEISARPISGTPYTDVTVTVGNIRVEMGLLDYEETADLTRTLEEAAEFLHDRMRAIREWKER
jgi:hypothetical protein